MRLLLCTELSSAFFFWSQIPGVPDLEDAQSVWQELVELLGKGGASSRAIAERLHKLKTKESGADLAEKEEEGKSATLAEKQLKIQLKGVQSQVQEMGKRLSKESVDKEKALAQQRELKEQVKALQLELQEANSGSRKVKGLETVDPTSLSGKKKLLQKKAQALMSERISKQKKPESP